MAIDFTGDAQISGIPFQTGFFSDLGSSDKTEERGQFHGFLSTMETINSGDCSISGGIGNRFESISGECKDDGVGNRFGTLNGSTPTIQQTPYHQGDFRIYDDPTHEGPFNLHKDFYTYDKLNQEYIKRGSSRIVVQKLNKEQTTVDPTYGESDGQEFFKKGVSVYGLYELNPIIQELSKFGISEDEDVILKFNYTHLLERLGRPILPGDLVIVYLTSPRLTQAQLSQDQKSRDYYVRQIQKIYRVNTAIPKDLFLYNYLTIECNCEKTNLDVEVPWDFDDVYEMDEVPPDINDEDPNPIPIDY